MPNIRVINEEKKCPSCGKMDIGVEENGEFICTRCFGKKYHSPEELAEIEKEVASLTIIP